MKQFKKFPLVVSKERKTKAICVRLRPTTARKLVKLTRVHDANMTNTLEGLIDWAYQGSR
jgi:hypothetical protein